MDYRMYDSFAALSENYFKYYDNCQKNGKKAKGLVGYIASLMKNN